MKKSLYLVDIFSFIFRAYYAIRPLSAPDGTPVNAVYGVITMMNKLIETKKPDHLVVCMESKEKKTFREDLFPEYKANRGPAPEDLGPQIALVDEFVRTYPMQTLSIPGYEADDIIATLATKFSKGHDLDVIIVTSDKDLMQLVDDDVCLYDTMKDKVLREKEVIEKFGVPPNKVVDVQSLCGDPTDNIPGILGVGPKTASKLIQEYGSLDNVMERAQAIKGKVGEKIAAGREDLILSRKLVTLDRHVPLNVRYDDLILKTPDTERLQTFFHRLGFKTLGRNMDRTQASPAVISSPPSEEASLAPKTRIAAFKTVATADELRRIVGEFKKAGVGPFAFDTETDSTDALRANLVGVSFCFDADTAYYVPVAHKAGMNLDLADVKTLLGLILADATVPKIAQNAKYDVNVLVRHGFEIAGLADDTLIQSYLVDPEGSHSLDTLAERYLGHRMIAYADVVKKGQTFADVDIQTATEYSAEDAWAAFRLRSILAEKLAERGGEKIYREVELPLVSVLARMERDGILADRKLLESLGAEFRRRISQLENDCHKAAGAEFNVNSTKQLGEILFEKLGLPVIKKNKTGYSTDVDVLTALAKRHELPRLMLEYRMLAKLLSTYVEQLSALIDPETGRIHTHFNQAVVATGRLSSTEPNLQNIPVKTPEGRRIREVFVAPEGSVLFSADYSQIELRLLAAFSRDPKLVGAYRDGIDVHRKTAAGIFGIAVDEVSAEQRSIGKTINFGVIYGQSAFGLAQMLEVPQAEAKHFITRFYQEFERVRVYRDEVLDEARRRGYVETCLGRRRYLPELSSRNQLARQNAERAAFNAVFQGSAADLIKKAMVLIAGELAKSRLLTKMILQVHDELVFEVPKNELETVETLVPRIMESALEFGVPLKVGCNHGKNWGEAH
jgi:DNA polymerase-1